MMLGVSMLIALLMAIGILASIQNQKTQDEYQHLLDNDAEMRFLLKNVQYRITSLSNDERAYLLTGDTSYPGEIEAKKTEITTTMKTVQSKHIPENIQKALVTLDKELVAYYAISDKVVSTYQKDPAQALQIHMVEERDLRKEHLTPALDAVIELIDSEMAKNTVILQEHNSQTLVIIRTAFIISILVGVMVLLALRQALKPIEQLQTALAYVTEGDLTKNINVTSKDEIGQLAQGLNTMIVTLRQTIATIYDTSHQVATSAEELNASSDQSTLTTEHLSNLTQNFAESTEQQLHKFIDMSNTISELSSTIQQVYVNGEEMDHLSNTAKEATVVGSTGMTGIVSEMNVIYGSVEDTYKMIQGLEEKSTAIEHIVSLISSLAEQTNLLALNAAIEAARAGEHGKGFAVVADEVRKLAEESKTSANNVREVLVEIQRETEVAVHSMSNGLEKVKSGMAVTQQVNGTFQTIDASISQLSKKVAEVSNHLRDMSMQSERVVTFVEEVKSLAESNTTAIHDSTAATQEQLASSEEISSAAETLARLADEQKSMVAQFKI